MRRRWPGGARAAAALLLALLVPAVSAAGDCPPMPPPPSAAAWADAQRAARDHGLLWRLSKDGRVSYLFGSIHVGRLAWRFPGPALREALAQSDVLALEIDPTDPAVAERMARAARSPRSSLPEGLQRRLLAQVRAACLSEAALRGLHPVLQVLSLSLLAARRDGLDPAHAQELMLAEAARHAGLPVVSLESVDRQLQALLPTDAAQTDALVDQALRQLEQGSVRPTLRRLAEAWAAGDLGTLQSYASWCECADTQDERAWLRRLNDDRNPHLAAGIDALHGQGKRVFAAVGALHMSGAMALPGLLAQRGFSVQRVPF